MAPLGMSTGVGGVRTDLVVRKLGVQVCCNSTAGRSSSFFRKACGRKFSFSSCDSTSTAVNLPTGSEILDSSASSDGSSIRIELPGDGGAGRSTGGDGGRWNNGGGGGGGGGDGGEGNGWEYPGEGSPFALFGLWEAFLKGWRARVRTDPQFVFKVLTEQVIGVGACVLGDMASRPNFGLNELDFVFSTVVVGSILNFALMYLLAPASAGADITRLPSIFASCPPGHMFEPGAYTLAERMGTFVYKGAVFALTGFLAGLFGTAISTLLLNARKKVDPSFEMQNKPPPTLLNAATWALHMGLSSNLRYQSINGMEYLLAGSLHPAVFKTFIFAIRMANNILGGTSFVLLARLTGSQKAQRKQAM